MAQSDATIRRRLRDPAGQHDTLELETPTCVEWMPRHIIERTVHPGELGLWAMILDFSGASVALRAGPRKGERAVSDDASALRNGNPFGGIPSRAGFAISLGVVGERRLVDRLK